MKKTLIVGGANGIGLAIAIELSKRKSCEKVYIVDKQPLSEEYKGYNIEHYTFDLISNDYSFFDKFNDIDSLIITAGFGKLALFKDVTEQHIIDSFAVNTLPVLRLVKKFYNKLENHDDFYCCVLVSIAGFMSSPFFSVYASTKAALKIFIESVNVELEKSGTTNRILNVSPGSIKGTSFNNAKTDLSKTKELANEIISHVEKKDDLYIPQYEDIFYDVLERYHNDFREEGRHSYEYKLNSGRLNA